MKLGGRLEVEEIATDIFNNEKRRNKLIREKNRFKRIKLAEGYAVAELARRKLKGDPEDISHITWKVLDYYDEIREKN